MAVESENPKGPRHIALFHTFPDAKSVSIAGSFNDWKPTPVSLQDRWCDFWRADLTLPPGQYEYRFLVDGQWVDDVSNPRRVPNPFGGYNGIFSVEADSHQNSAIEGATAGDLFIKSDLDSKFKSRIEFEPGDESHFIDVTVLNGIVTLKGAVPGYLNKVVILKTLAEERDVLGWTDNVVIELPPNMRRSDAQIAEAAVTAIAQTTTIPGNSIHVTVRDGWLYLEGAVDHSCQRQAAEYAVQCLAGLLGILNLIRVGNVCQTL